MFWGYQKDALLCGAAPKVAYSPAGDPAGAQPGEDSLKIPTLAVDSAVKEETAGDAREVTDRSFAVRRAGRLNDEMPGDKPANAPEPNWVGSAVTASGKSVYAVMAQLAARKAPCWQIGGRTLLRRDEASRSGL